MRILIVCSGNTESGDFKFEVNQPFIYEQTKSLELLDIKIELFLIKGKGVLGYLKNIKKLRAAVTGKDFDIIHAHNGPSGFIAIFQRIVPVIITFHGSDINIKYLNVLSSFACLFSKWSIFVSRKLYDKIYIKPNKKYNIIPCGINLNLFYPADKGLARNKLGLSSDRKYILFGSAFNIQVKNYSLAKKALELADVNCELIELKNRSREEVCCLLNACDVLLMTSKSEGSPQVIKEGMACNCPIVSTDVGDIRNIISATEGCFLTDFTPEDVALKIAMALEFKQRTIGGEQIKKFDNRIITEQIYNVYKLVIKQGSEKQ